MQSKITLEPVGEPLSLVAAKLHLRVDHASDDLLITSLIRVAREMCEVYEGRSYLVRTMQVKLDSFQNEIRLPFPPLVSVSSITYIDAAGDTQTLSTDYYEVDTHTEPGRVYLAYNYNWPSVRPYPQVITITYKAGYMTRFTASGSTITVSDAVFADGDTVRLTNDQGDLPAGLADSTTYYVRDVSGSTLKLAATSGGAAITTTDAGTVPHWIGAVEIPHRVMAAMKLILSHLYEHRAEVSEINLYDMPLGAKHLLFDRSFEV